ncbi:MAG TPA: cytochrome c-type biogenesis protein CcmH [Gemmatimonadaceae bacterium]|nr:cytochrome c-type biogenesis protein CcmH [Gemmatimonadaceae bacterium]
MRPIPRREALRLGAASALLLVARDALAQGAASRDSTGAPNGPTDGASGSNLFSMDQGAARTVRRPPKPDATTRISDEERDATEKRLRCQCGCTLDVYTCRTTDFACEVSPAMHRDIISLVEGGYGAQEIVDAFVGSYGEKVLMAPTKRGFNLVGWTMPFGALLVGGGMLAILLRRWHRRAAAVRTTERAPAAVPGVDATDDELRRIEAAVRGDAS